MPVSFAHPSSSSAGMKKSDAGVTPSCAQTSSVRASCGIGKLSFVGRPRMNVS